jgi:hypothetical protein
MNDHVVDDVVFAAAAAVVVVVNVAEGITGKSSNKKTILSVLYLY